jgi:hypothetical protein
LENLRKFTDRKIERKKLQPIEGAGIAKLYLRLKNVAETMFSINLPHRIAVLIPSPSNVERVVSLIKSSSFNFLWTFCK